MFIVNEDKSIYLTRGDVAFFSITAEKDTEEAYKFQPGDVVRFKVTERKACDKVVLSKDFGIEEETEEIEILLEEKDTKIGGVISKPVDYWYEVELNPYTDPQTIVGYDDDGAKIFKLFPEGADVKEEPITPEDIPIVDEELSLTSTRPVQNQAIYRAILKIREENAAEMERLDEFIEGKLSKVKEVEAELDRIAEETEVKLARFDEFAEKLESFDEIEEKLTKVDEIETEIEENLVTKNEAAACIVHKKTIQIPSDSVTGSYVITNMLEWEIFNWFQGVDDIIFVRAYDPVNPLYGTEYTVFFTKTPCAMSGTREWEWMFDVTKLENGTLQAVDQNEFPLALEVYYIPSVVVD